MTVGNLVALRQRRMVRLLAWSSVAQAGYILAPLGALALAAGRTADARPVASRPPSRTPSSSWSWSSPPSPRWSRCAGGADGGTLDDYRGRGPPRTLAWPRRSVLALAGLAGLPPGLAGLFAKVDRGPGAAGRRRGLAGAWWWRSTR